MWTPLVEQLESQCRLLIPDLPGHDHGSAESYRSHEETTATIASLLEARSSESAIVVGFSLGAQLSVLLAARYPHLVRDVVVISAQARPTPFQGATLALLRMTASLAKNKRFARLQAKELIVPESLMDDYMRTSRGITPPTLLAAVGENIRFTIPKGWAEFAGRSLVLVGDDERSMMKESARLLASTHGRGELVVAEGCGHGIPLQQPELLARHIERWLR